MNNQNLVIYEFDELYKIFFEIKKDINLNFEKSNKEQLSELNSNLSGCSFETFFKLIYQPLQKLYPLILIQQVRQPTYVLLLNNPLLVSEKILVL